jgi:hypothetical protein
LEKQLKIAASAVLIGSILLVAMIAYQSSLFAGRVVPGLDFEEIDKGSYCGIKSRVDYVISDNASWNTLWTDLHNISTGHPDLPFVNFSREVVIAVFIGEFSTGGYSATISRIDFTLFGTAVYVDEVHPGAGCGVTMALTQPYHIVKAEINAAVSVQFVYDLITHDCP